MVDQVKNNYNHYLLPFILGFITISMALIAANQIVIFIAVNSKYFFTLLCTIFLALIAGFIVFHFFSDFFRKKQQLIWILFIICLSCIFSSIYFNFLLNHFSSEVVFVIFLITGPFVLYCLMGALFAMALTQQNSKTAISLSIFSFGLLSGAIITSFFMITIFGISWVIFLNCSLLAWSILAGIDNFIQEIITASLVLAILLVAFALNIEASASSILSDSYHAINNKKFTTITPSKSIVSSLLEMSTTDPKNPYPYIPLIERILYQDLKFTNENVLVMGEGVYQFAQLNNSMIHFTYLNDATDSLPSACTYLDIISKGDVVASFAKHQLFNVAQPYQAIIANLFPNTTNIPEKLLSYQHLTEIRDALPKDGVAMINVLARPTLSDHYSKRVDNTIRSVFPSCMAIPLAYINTPTNIIYICRKSDKDMDNTIYSENNQ